jgi:hypothetical protein
MVGVTEGVGVLVFVGVTVGVTVLDGGANLTIIWSLLFSVLNPVSSGDSAAKNTGNKDIEGVVLGVEVFDGVKEGDTEGLIVVDGVIDGVGVGVLVDVGVGVVVLVTLGVTDEVLDGVIEGVGVDVFDGVGLLLSVID